jgi:predicted ATPase
MVQSNIRTTELDPDLLSTPFEIQTNWHVLTGAACTGKTTLIDMLADQGFRVIPESARLYFEKEMTKGRTLEEVCRDGPALQRGIAALQLRFEYGVQANQLTFLDRAIPDSLAFYRIHGMDPNEILPECFHHRYAGVFILERLPFHRDQTLGPEDNAASDFLNEWLARDYSALGYVVVRVPVLSPKERLAFILERLSGKGHIYIRV